MFATSMGGRLRGEETGERGTSSVESSESREELGARAADMRVESGRLSLGARTGSAGPLALARSSPVALSSEPLGNVLRRSTEKPAGSVEDRGPGSRDAGAG